MILYVIKHIQNNTTSIFKLTRDIYLKCRFIFNIKHDRHETLRSYQHNTSLRSQTLRNFNDGDIVGLTHQ